MRSIKILLFILFISETVIATNHSQKLDSIAAEKIDTNYIQDFDENLNIKLVDEVDDNKFSVKDNVTQKTYGYDINTAVNLGFGVDYRGIGFELLFTPTSVNNDDYLYGKTNQFSLSTSANTRRFIYSAYIRFNQGFHSTTGSKIPGDTTGAVAYYYRPDITNYDVGAEFTYIVKNKKFSSSAPYDFTQRQIKSAGSLLVGGFFSFYGINADSVVIPDSLKENFKPAVQFRKASTFTMGATCGYTFTKVFHKYWFINIYLLPGLAIQEYTSINAYGQQTKPSVTLGLTFQSRLAFGVNKKKNYLGIAFTGNDYTISNDTKSSLNYHYGSIRLCYGHRFDAPKILKRQVDKMKWLTKWL
jgi:hypothetical protein